MPETPYYEDDAVTLYHGDCREVLLSVSGDICLTDPPYGVTDHAWDVVVPAYHWMVAPACVAFASEPYATALIQESLLAFRYDLVWAKNTASNHMNASKRPLRTHERILVFGNPPYNAQKVPRTETEMARLNRQQRLSSGYRHPGSVLSFDAVNNRNGARTPHPSQKPVELMRWLVRTYSNEDDVIVDPFAGSGSTLRAAKDEGRRVVGVEADERFCEAAALRCSQEVLAA